MHENILNGIKVIEDNLKMSNLHYYLRWTNPSENYKF